MRIWHINVGVVLLLVRAENENQAIDLARVAAADFYPFNEDMNNLPAGIQTDLDLEGEPEVLDAYIC